jgi:hypothetical protein
MKLLIYKINNIPLNQLDYYNVSDLNGNSAYKDIEDNFKNYGNWRCMYIEN